MTPEVTQTVSLRVCGRIQDYQRRLATNYDANSLRYVNSLMSSLILVM